MKKLSPEVEALFADALALPPAERGMFLAKACGADIDLLAHLVALVAAHEGPDDILESLAPPAKGLPKEYSGMDTRQVISGDDPIEGKIHQRESWVMVGYRKLFTSHVS